MIMVEKNMEKQKRKAWIIAIYAAALVFFGFKMFYYAAEIQGVPDEGMHVGYVLYLKEHPGKIIPDFEQMNSYRETDGDVYYRTSDSWNYLGHPPLYYHMMKWFTHVSETEDGGLKVNVRTLRYVNIFLMMFSMLLCFYVIGSRVYRASERIGPHVVLAVSAISVPMLAYNGSGVNNDNLTLIGIVLFLWGLLRYYEDKIEWRTYLLVDGGFFISIFTKLVAGEILVIVLAGVVIGDLIRKKGFRVFTNKYFLGTMILFLIPVLYYLYIYYRYGTFQPSLQALHPEYYKITRFYVPEENRGEVYSLPQYWNYYWPNFWKTWTILYGHTEWVAKTGKILAQAGSYLIIILVPVYAVRSCIQKKNEWPMCVSFTLAILITAATQFLSAYKTYCSAGYDGGYQARYYLCMIPFFAYCDALSDAETWNRKENNRIKKILIWTAEAVYVGLVLYGDFIYFGLNASFSL